MVTYCVFQRPHPCLRSHGGLVLGVGHLADSSERVAGGHGGQSRDDGLGARPLVTAGSSQLQGWRCGTCVQPPGRSHCLRTR